MANTFSLQSNVVKALATSWKASEGFSSKVTFRNDLIPGAVKNTGYGTTIRRASQVLATQSATDVNYNLPGVTQPVAPAAYADLVDATLPLTVSQRFEVNIQASMEEMTFKLDKNDVKDRFIDPATVSMQEQINLWVSGLIAATCGQVLDSSTSTQTTAGDKFMETLLNAKALMTYRKGLQNGQKKTLLINPAVMPKLGMANAKVFNAGSGANDIYDTGIVPNLAGFDIYESPLLDVSTVSALGSPVVTALAFTAPGATAPTATLPTSWVPTFSVSFSGFTANVVIPAGTKLKFANSGTAVNWAAPFTGVDTGFVATFTVTSTVTATAGGLATLVLSEPAIATGAFKNIVTPIAVGSTASLAIATGTARSSYAFANDAVVLVSPEVSIPEGTVNSRNLKLGGFNVGMIEDRWPGTLQNIVKLVCFVGGAVPKPEGVCNIV